MFPIRIFSVVQHGEQTYACYIDGEENVSLSPSLEALAVYLVGTIRAEREDAYRLFRDRPGLIAHEIGFRTVPGITLAGHLFDEVHLLSEEERDVFINFVNAHLDLCYHEQV